MKFAITPCPNDTFTYFGLIDGAVESDFEFVFDDIEKLNLAAENGTYPITKMSFAQYAKCADKYELLDAGAALGMGTGPVLVGRGEIDADCVFAVPGINTTAALLLKHKFGKNVKMRPMHFRKIADAVAAGEFRAGVLIHEGRFVYESLGLELLCDLGAEWSNSTGLPVPLGCICVRRDFSERRPAIEAAIRASLNAAFADPEKTYPYVANMAQYLDPDVLRKHIYAFVNDYSFDISPIRKKLLDSLC